MPAFGIFEVADQMNDKSKYYLAEMNNKQYFITISNEFIEYSELTKRVDGRKFEIGNIVYSKIGYTLKMIKTQVRERKKFFLSLIII